MLTGEAGGRGGTPRFKPAARHIWAGSAQAVTPRPSPSAWSDHTAPPSAHADIYRPSPATVPGHSPARGERGSDITPPFRLLAPGLKIIRREAGRPGPKVSKYW